MEIFDLHRMPTKVMHFFFVDNGMQQRKETHTHPHITLTSLKIML